MLWQDGPKLIGLGGVLQVEVVPEDDAFGIACLNRGFADGTQFRDEHRNERVAEHVVGEVEFLGEAVAPPFEISADDREFLQRVGAEPRGEIRLNLHLARLAHLRDLGGNVNHPVDQIHRIGFELGDFIVRHARRSCPKRSRRSGFSTFRKANYELSRNIVKGSISLKTTKAPTCVGAFMIPAEFLLSL